MSKWGWRLHWQDFTHHRFGQPKPAPQWLDFPTRAAAEDARKGLVQHIELRVCVTPVPEPRASKAAKTRERDAASELFVPALPLQTKPRI